MNCFTPLFALPLAGIGLLSANVPFPTVEQLRPLETAAAKAHPLPEALRLRLLDQLAADIVAPLRTPMRRLWLPRDFTFDASAFRQAFEHDWNDRDDAPERMRELNVQFADVLDALRQAQHERETRMIEELSRMPGVITLENGMLCEPLPGEHPVPLSRADSIEACDLRGDVYYAAPIGEGDLIDIADLPSCIAELADRLPAASTWVFIVPTYLLRQEECRNMPLESGYLALILRHGEKEDASPGAWSRLADAWNSAKPARNETTHIEALRAGISRYAGHSIALLIKKSLYHASSDPIPFDKEQLESALLRHLNAIASASLQNASRKAADREETWASYKAIMEARQTEVERGLLRLHAGLPGVHVEDSGVQYAIEKSDHPEENKPFAQANRVAVARVNGKKLFEQSMRPGDIPCLAELVSRMPEGQSWRFLIPASQIGDYKLLDDMGAGVALTFTVCDTGDDAEDTGGEISVGPTAAEEDGDGPQEGNVAPAANQPFPTPANR